MYEYALTVKNNFKGKMMYREDYELLLSELFKWKGIKVGVIHYELDSNSRIHIHTLLMSDQPLKYKEFMRKGWHIYIRRITDNLAGWLHYTTKEPRTYDQLLQARIIQLAQTENLFVDFDKLV